MNLGTLLKKSGIACPQPSAEVTSVTANVNDVKKGSLFVAVKGRLADGNDFIGEAFSRGAVAVISDSAEENEKIIRVSHARRLYPFLCSSFFGDPQDKLKIIGITGTNGKTTTAEYIRHIFTFAGRKCAVSGTLGSSFEDYSRQTGFTTPEPPVLFEELSRYRDMGAEFAVLEVSSQALCQHRVDPIVFETGVFTNIGRDHLDYHSDLENYMESKMLLGRLSKKALVNSDSLFGKMKDFTYGKNTVTYSAKDIPADISAKNVRMTKDSISYLLFAEGVIKRVRLTGTGEILLYNSLAAAAASLISGIDPSVVSEALGCLPRVQGRMKKLTYGERDIYIDYAHTPDALFSVLSQLKKQCTNRLICVFGCGGNRDKGKRSEMGKIASHFCDSIVITSDNPRDEDPAEIAEDIIKDINNKYNIYVELDREKAIGYALRKACAGDIVLIAGKGHEEYQLTAGKKKFFSDEQAVKKLLGV